MKSKQPIKRDSSTATGESSPSFSPAGGKPARVAMCGPIAGLPTYGGSARKTRTALAVGARQLVASLRTSLPLIAGVRDLRRPLLRDSWIAASHLRG